MRTLLIISAVLVLALSATGASAAQYETTVNADETVTVEGAVTVGANPDYFGAAGVGPVGTCSDDPTAYCDSVFVTLNNPVEDDGDPDTNKTDRQLLDILLTPTIPAADLDLIVFAADAEGNRLGELGQSALAPVADCETSCERVFTSITTSEEVPTKYIVVDVVYFAGATGWTLDLNF